LRGKQEEHAIVQSCRILDDKNVEYCSSFSMSQADVSWKIPDSTTYSTH
jgi:hypothetical protein